MTIQKRNVQLLERIGQARRSELAEAHRLETAAALREAGLPAKIVRVVAAATAHEQAPGTNHVNGRTRLQIAKLRLDNARRKRERRLWRETRWHIYGGPAPFWLKRLPVAER